MLKLFQARGVLAVLAVGFGSAALLAIMAWRLLEHTPHYDELLHVLSARGWLASGAPVIADGLYSRAELFTRAVAWSFQLFGDTLEAARMPAVAAGAALVGLLGAWVTRRTGLLAGATAAGLLCVVPMSTEFAVFARFYTLHALVVALLFIVMFEATDRNQSGARRGGLVVTALLLVALAWHLQPTTIIAVGAGLMGIAALPALDYWAAIRPQLQRHLAWAVVGVALAAGVALWGLNHLGFLDQLGETAMWAEHQAGRRQYYVVGLGRELPLLWPLLPVAAALALYHPDTRRLALFSAVVVFVGLLVHSVAAQKAMRYVYYLVPWFCVLWGCGLGAVTLRSGGGAASGGVPGRSLPPILILVLLGIGFVFSSEGNRALNLAAGRLGAIANLPYQDEPDWSPAAGELAARAAAADRIVTSNSMKALYYLGHYDFELNATIVPETDSGEEFGRDFRTGRHAISTAASTGAVLDLPGTALVVLEESKIGRRSGVPADSFSIIEASCEELTLPGELRIRAWSCPRGN